MVSRFAGRFRTGRYAGRFGTHTQGPSVPTFYYPDGEVSFTPVDVVTGGATPTWKFYDNAGTLEAEYTALEPTHNFVGAGPYRIEIHDGQDVTRLHLGNSQVSGDIASLASLTSLDRLYLYGTQVSGDIASLASLTGLTDLRVNSTQVTGDVSSLASLTSLDWLYLYSTQVTGDVSSLASLTSLSRLLSGGTQVSGDIASLASLTGLTYLFLDFTSISGDVASLTSLTNLVSLRLNDAQVSGELDLSAATTISDTNISDCGLTQSEVDAAIDNIYQARAAFTDTTPALQIGGTNAAPSGVYQNAVTPTTGKEKIYKLVNDPDAEGFNTWAITYTA